MMTSPPRSVDEIRQHQLRALQSGLKTVRRTNAFYRDRLHDVSSWNDFERLPVTTKAELMIDQRDHPPYGTNLTFPLEHYVRLHQTSGTSGSQPLRWLDTAESWAWWERIWADLIYAPAGVTPDDRIFFAFSFGPFIGFWSAFGGSQQLGAMAIPGGAMTTIQRVQVMRDRTGDRVEVTRDPCSCGSPFMKIVGGIRGRVDDMVTIRGVNVYPSQVEDIVRRHPTVVEFVIECRTDRQMDEATVVLELTDGAVADDVSRAIAEQLRTTLGIRIECRIVPQGTLPRPELKAKRLIRVVT